MDKPNSKFDGLIKNQEAWGSERGFSDSIWSRIPFFSSHVFYFLFVSRSKDSLLYLFTRLLQFTSNEINVPLKKVKTVGNTMVSFNFYRRNN